MKTKLIVIVLVFLAATALSFWAANAFYHSTGTDKDRWTHRFEHEHLHLSPEQKQHVDSLKQLLWEKTAALRADARTARLELIELLSQPEPDKHAIDQKITEIAHVQEALQREVVEHLLEMKSVLSQEQQEWLLNAMYKGLGGGKHERPCSRMGGEKHDENSVHDKRR